MLGCVMAGTPARCARAFSSGTRARLTISRATSAFSLFLRPRLGCFLASHGVDRDKASVVMVDIIESDMQ